jgi:hypothetical protein
LIGTVMNCNGRGVVVGAKNIAVQK